MKHTSFFRRGAGLVLALALVLSTLAGCSNAGNSSSSESSGFASSTVSQVQESSSDISSASEVSGTVSETSQVESAIEITLKVVHGDGSEKEFPISTSAANLREALEAEGLIEGEESSYGLFVKTVDGETADDSKEQWWCLTKGGEMWNYGVDDTEISDGDTFEFTLTEGY